MRYQNKRIVAEARISYALHGVDNAGVNYGGDVFVQDINHPNEFGNYVGQGNAQRIIFGEIKAGYIINPAYGLRVEAGFIYRDMQSSTESLQTPVVYFGFRTRIPTMVTDY